MPPLIKINLLPYREAIAQKKQHAFKTFMLLALLVGCMLAILAYLFLSQQISSQETRNTTLTQGISQLDQAIAQVNELKSERDHFLTQKNAVEALEEKRFEAAKIIDSINILVPEGLYITSIIGKDPSTYTINGRAISDGKIAQFMSKLPSNGRFMPPELLSITRNNNAQEFSLQVSLNTQADISSIAPSDGPASINQPSDNASDVVSNSNSPQGSATNSAAPDTSTPPQVIQ